MTMIDYAAKQDGRWRERLAPLLAAAALLCAGCGAGEREAPTAYAERSSERASSISGRTEQAGEYGLPETEIAAPPAAAPHASPADAERQAAAQTAAASSAEQQAAQQIAVPPAGHSAASAKPASPATTAAAVPESASANERPPRRAVFSIPVLNYHSIGVEPDNNAVLDPRKLDEQMAHLAREGYAALSLRQFADIWDGRADAPAKAVLLTFDDGYADNYTEALPILQKYGFRATLFVSPGMAGQDGYFADWEQIRALRDAGWDIQPHGMTHPYLHKLPLEEQRFEIAESIKQLREHTGIETMAFCYPYGTRNQTTLRLLEEHGVRFAFTIDQGRTEPEQHPLQLKRLFVGGKDSLAAFVKKLD